MHCLIHLDSVLVGMPELNLDKIQHKLDKVQEHIESCVEEEVHKTDSLYKLSFFHYRCIAHSFVYTISKQTARDSQSKSISDRFPTDWAFNDLVSTELTCPMRGRRSSFSCPYTPDTGSEGEVCVRERERES